METFWVYLVQGAGLGMAAAVQPGPFLTFLISRTLANGDRRTLPAVLAPFLSDGPIILLMLLILDNLPEWMIRLLNLAGGLFLLLLAWSSLKHWHQPQDSPPQSTRQSIWQATFVNLLGPGPYLYWGLVTGPILLTGWQASPLIGITFLVGFYGSMIVALAGIVLAFGGAQRFGPRISRVLLGISALALFVFGLMQVYRSLQSIF